TFGRVRRPGEHGAGSTNPLHRLRVCLIQSIENYQIPLQPGPQKSRAVAPRVTGEKMATELEVRKPRRRLRWWVLGLILALTAGAIVYFWSSKNLEPAFRIPFTIMALMAS